MTEFDSAYLSFTALRAFETFSINLHTELVVSGVLWNKPALFSEWVAAAVIVPPCVCGSSFTSLIQSPEYCVALYRPASLRLEMVIAGS